MLAKIEKWFDRVFNLIIMSALFCLVALVLAQVYVRFLSVGSLTWSEELSRFIMIWMVFLASVQLFRKNGHIWVDNIIGIFPPKIKSTALILGNVLTIAFFVIISSGTFTLIPMTYTQYTPALAIPKAYVYSVVPLSMILTMFFAIKNLVLEIKNFGKEV